MSNIAVNIIEDESREIVLTQMTSANRNRLLKENAQN
jgi:hypothetical protein